MSTCAGEGTVAVDDATRQQASDAVLCLINRERAVRGLSALRVSSPLATAAATHSSEMVDGRYVSHTSPNGDSVRRRVLRTGYIARSRVTIVGETITWGSGAFSTPTQLVAAMMASPPHRQVILDRRFRDVGIGMVLAAPMEGIDGSAATVTLDYGRR